MGQRLNVFEKLTPEISNYITSSLSHDSAADSNLLTPDDYERPVDIRLIDESGQFLGLGAVSLIGRLQPKKLIQR